MNEEVVSAHLLGADSGQNDVVAAHIHHRVAVVERDLTSWKVRWPAIEHDVSMPGLKSVMCALVAMPKMNDPVPTAGHCLIPGVGNQNIVPWAADERIEPF